MEKSQDDAQMSTEEVRLLCQRVKLIDSYLDSAGVKKPTATSASASLPPLRDALALEIPFDLKQRLVASATDKVISPPLSFGFTLGLNSSMGPVDVLEPNQVNPSLASLAIKSDVIDKSNGCAAADPTPPAKR